MRCGPYDYYKDKDQRHWIPDQVGDDRGRVRTAGAMGWWGIIYFVDCGFQLPARVAGLFSTI